jgi:sialic acid synthase SpsE
MTNIALVRKMAGLGIPVIISTGMAYIYEVKAVVHEFERHGAKDIMIMHCTSLYPAPAESLNLNSIITLRRTFKYPIGYSDHTTSNISSISAVCLGASIIEKHFTIYRKYGGPEQAFSYDMSEFKKLVEEVRYAEKALGSFDKAPSKEELKLREKYRRCLVANKNIKKGELFTGEIIGMKRPLSKPGLNTSYFERIIGRKAARYIAKDAPIYANSIKGR